MHKGAKNKPVSSASQAHNGLISKFRFRVEQGFGGMKEWFAGRIAKYVGEARAPGQHVLEAIGYNRY